MKEGLENNKELKEYLEKHIMLFEPKKYLSKYIKSVYDIYFNRYLLRRLGHCDFAVNYIAKIILFAIHKNKRFRQLDCLKTLRYILKNKDESDEDLSSSTISLLFKLYKHYILGGKEELQNCVNIFIKDKLLKEKELEWLINNYNKSNHCINRLLRYPLKNHLISIWASKVYKENKIENRDSELIALFIKDDFSYLLTKNYDKETLIWAVYYSKMDLAKKSKILNELFDINLLNSFMEVCIRLNLISTIKNLLKQ